MDDENDVEAIHIEAKGKWKRLLFGNVYLDFLPQIGHAEAGHYPDLPYLTWEYIPASSKEYTERHNTDEFMRAAEAIYYALRKPARASPGKRVPWPEIAGDVLSCLSFVEVLLLQTEPFKHAFVTTR